MAARAGSTGWPSIRPIGAAGWPARLIAEAERWFVEDQGLEIWAALIEGENQDSQALFAALDYQPPRRGLRQQAHAAGGVSGDAETR